MARKTLPRCWPIPPGMSGEKQLSHQPLPCLGISMTGVSPWQKDSDRLRPDQRGAAEWDGGWSRPQTRKRWRHLSCFAGERRGREDPSEIFNPLTWGSVLSRCKATPAPVLISPSLQDGFGSGSPPLLTPVSAKAVGIGDSHSPNTPDSHERATLRLWGTLSLSNMPPRRVVWWADHGCPPGAHQAALLLPLFNWARETKYNKRLVG